MKEKLKIVIFITLIVTIVINFNVYAINEQQIDNSYNEESLDQNANKNDSSLIKENTNIEESTVNSEKKETESIVKENNSKNISNEDSLVQKREETPTIVYESHIQTYGWQGEKQNGEISGTTGLSKRLEAIKISLQNVDGDVEYIGYTQTYGWQNWVSNGEISGTVGESKRLEAIKIKLTGNIANEYDIYYRVHIQSYGWLGWAKNGATAGSAELAKRIEAIEIKLVKKDSGEATGNSYVYKKEKLQYTSYVQKKGWLDYVNENQTSGTIGQALMVEAISINLLDIETPGLIEYQAYVENNGWESDWKESGQISGTIGQAKKIKAIRMRLTKDLAEKYDIYYRTHLQGFGWLGWAKNGEIAGTMDFDFRVEAYEIKLVKKNTGEATGNSEEEKETNITYQAHVQSIGNQNIVSEGQIAGTTGQRKNLEGLIINLNTTLTGNVEYQSFIEDSDFGEWQKNGELTGTTGQHKAIQLIKIRLTDQLSEKYDIYYRVHSEKYGWLGWAKNGETAGASYYNIQAIEIKLYLKIDSAKKNLNTNNHYLETGFYKDNNTGYTYYKDKYGNNAMDWINIMGTKYFFNSLGVMIGKDVRKVIDVSAYQQDIDWDKVKNEGNIDGVIVRIAAGCELEDSKLARNISELKRLNIPYGIYIYSYAENKNEGNLYGNFTVQMIKKYLLNPTLGIYLDLESNNITSYMGISQYTEVIKGFTDTLFANGYGNITKIYTYKTYADTALNSDYIRNQITWIAQYNHFCTYTGSYNAWQYSSKELIPGIVGNVDASVWFTKF